MIDDTGLRRFPTTYDLRPAVASYSALSGSSCMTRRTRLAAACQRPFADGTEVGIFGVALFPVHCSVTGPLV